ncbi:hypothetical protein BGZ73_001486 [Actinomortierella ambigua]|nr:hypothetical protein BGZ73_001486 [Actinomortierella ambigua]
MLRPLGMLAFGLGVIVTFIRMHGDSYDFPTKVSQSNESLPLPHDQQRHRVDTVVLEVSTLFPEDPALIYPPQSDHSALAVAAAFFLEHEVPLEYVGRQEDNEHKDEDGRPPAENTKQQQHQSLPLPPQPERTDLPLDDKKDNGQWPIRRHLSTHLSASQSDQWVQQNQPTATAQTVLRGGKEETWAWLAMIQHESDTCSPGVVYQYGRPLDSILYENDSKWQLLYTHKLPGSIIHTSVSRRLVPLSEETRARRRKERAENPASATRESTLHDDAREVSRLAVLYKVVQDESATYYLRMYHFGRFQPASQPLQDDCSGQRSDCHQHDPFVFFDYELPGSMPFKDFRLEHDTILYTRANDPHMFRYLRLPNLKVGATSPSQPYKLASGNSGPKQACKDVLNLIYRTSDLALVPKSHSNDETFSVLLTHVHEDNQGWTYGRSVASMDSNNQWTVEQAPIRRPERLHQESESLYEETTSYLPPKPDPLIVRSLDGKVLLLPYKNEIQTMDPSSSAPKSEGTRGDGNQQMQQQAAHGVANRRKQETRSKWQYHLIDRVAFDVMDPDLGALSDDQTIMALKTKRNNVLILRQVQLWPGLDVQPNQGWRMTMVLSDENYLFTLAPHRYKREVRAMRILQVPRSKLRTLENMSDTTAGDLNHSNGSHEAHQPTGQEGDAKDALQRILLMAFGDGHLVVYNLDEATPSSSMWTFIQEKYQVVIGMLAVVIVFVINEAR